MKATLFPIRTLALIPALALTSPPALAADFPAGPTPAADMNENSQTVIKAETRTSRRASDSTFTGTVHHESMLSATGDAPYAVSSVSFEPGARSFWHTHPAGQRLVVTSGSGLTGTADGKVEIINAGDVVDCPAGVKHWHGAAPTTAMSHIVITPMKNGKNVEWMEAVTDEQYSGSE